MIEVIAATRGSPAEFERDAPLAATMRRFKRVRGIRFRIVADNTASLSTVYNALINSSEDRDILVFLHDDVWIDDIFLGTRLREGLAQFDILGVAGTRRRFPGQPSWTVIDEAMTPDPEGASGAISHGTAPATSIDWFGSVPAQCELLDGVFLAARCSTLRKSGVAFDPQFDFHFYDMDFCRTARAAGLRLGTWPIALTHRSRGSFRSERWKENLALYREKWPD